MRYRLIISILAVLFSISATQAQQSGKGIEARRIDRQISSGSIFGYEGEYTVGVTASYGTLSSEDSSFWVFLDNINLAGTLTTVKPFFGYFYRDNRCVGARLGYQYMDGNLGNIDLDLGDQNDISMSLGGMHLRNNSYSASLFHRSYIAIDNKGQFGLFAEIEASAQFGNGEFVNGTGSAAKYTRNKNMKYELGFNPGIAAYIFPNVCTTVSIGLGGVQYTSIRQYDDAGNKIGARDASKMQFRLNVADINFGMVMHLWSKKSMTKRLKFRVVK